MFRTEVAAACEEVLIVSAHFSVSHASPVTVEQNLFIAVAAVQAHFEANV